MKILTWLPPDSVLNLSSSRETLVALWCVTGSSREWCPGGGAVLRRAAPVSTPRSVPFSSQNRNPKYKGFYFETHYRHND